MLKIPENCCSCTACAAICPKNRIEMKKNGEGFLYPAVDSSRCVDCGICNNVCPIGKEKVETKNEAFAAICKDDGIRKMSSSGGVFSLIAERIIGKGGAVFGAAFDSEFKVAHTKAETLETIAPIRTSKYVQSDMKNCFAEAKKLLDDGRWVLFTGTPCQIAGFKSYLRRDYDTLVTQDVFCLGVPSPAVWEDYKAFRAGGKKPIDVSFRHKLASERTYALRFAFEDGSELIERSYDCLYTKAFVGRLCLRESCYNCAFKGLSRISDITLADFWGVEKHCPEIDDGKGVSLVLLHSDKGRALFESIKGRLIYKEASPQKAVEDNPMAIQSAYRERRRDVFMHNYRKSGFEKAYRKSVKPSLKVKAKRFIKKMLGK